MALLHTLLYVFFFNDTATTEIYTLSLHDALPISFLFTLGGVGSTESPFSAVYQRLFQRLGLDIQKLREVSPRSEEHTSELQSQSNLVCRLLLEKKKNNQNT